MTAYLTSFFIRVNDTYFGTDATCVFLRNVHLCAFLVLLPVSAAGENHDLRVDGDVTIGTATAVEKLTVTGNICATGTIGACSDARYKRGIATLDNPLEIISKLRGVDFKWRADEFPEKQFSEKPQVGFIAQEIKEILPGVVSKGADGYYSVDYSRLTPVLVEAIKDQQNQIDELQILVDKLVSATQTNVTLSKK